MKDKHFEENRTAETDSSDIVGKFKKSKLRLEEEVIKVTALKNAIQKGIDSGIANDFDFKKKLQELKAKRESNS